MPDAKPDPANTPEDQTSNQETPKLTPCHADDSTISGSTGDDSAVLGDSEVVGSSDDDSAVVGSSDDESRLVESIREEIVAGTDSQIGNLLNALRPYLLKVANDQVPRELSLYTAPSDLVQETFYEAVQDFHRFQGKTDAELKAWLRQILTHNIQDAQRQFFETQKRKADLVRSIHESGMDIQLVDPGASPSSLFANAENSEKIMAAIGRLPEEYRLVVRLRHLERLRFKEIGAQMGRSENAARKLWARAVEQLAEELRSDDSR